MTEKRCTDCKYTKGIGYNFWCGEGHTEYEVFIGETNCPYYEYHDWSKGTPSKTEKRFTIFGEWHNDCVIDEIRDNTGEYVTIGRVVDLLNENEELKSRVEYLERKIDRERTSYQKQHEKWEEEIQKENEYIKNTIKEAYETERTDLGKSVLKQLLEQLQ